jgi:hypothetical protein
LLADLVELEERDALGRGRRSASAPVTASVVIS